MFEASYALTGKRDKIEHPHSDFIPKLQDVRRVPVRYQRTLPLSVIKSQQCVVLGASAHTLTVGIVGHKNEKLLDSLQILTSAAIFPVLVEPERMRLLIRRVERYQRFRQRYSRAYYVLLLPSQARLLQTLHEGIGI